MQHQQNSWYEDALVQAGGTIDELNSIHAMAENNHNGAYTRNNDINSIDNINEQYRIMAQMEAAIRVKDNTGFDMVEYKQRRALLEEQRRQEQEQTERPYHTKPKPKLPEAKPFVLGNSSGSDSSRPSNGSSRPEEPPLPFTRANRRYVQSARNRSDRVRVPEMSPGVVVHGSSTATTTTISTRDNKREHVVKCWGCSSASEKYLRVNVLATLVQCPDCLTVSPVT